MMTKELVFIHGRSQQGKDPDALKQEWLDALAAGLAANDPPLAPIDTHRVRFVYFGNALADLSAGTPPEEAADILLRGEGTSRDEAQRFLYEVLAEECRHFGITDEDISAAAESPVTERGPLNWPWVRAMLQRLDEQPQVSAAAIALATHDVFQYLTNNTIRMTIDRGVMTAMTPGVQSVVVAHSLGTVVAYTLLLREGTPRHWDVPLLATVGSPLAVNAIRQRAPGLGGVGGNRIPDCVAGWFNAFDPRDVVALYPLDPQHFPLNDPTEIIDNHTMDNNTPNRHGISGYLSNPVVAKRIYDALG